MDQPTLSTKSSDSETIIHSKISIYYGIKIQLLYGKHNSTFIKKNKHQNEAAPMILNDDDDDGDEFII